MNLAWVTFLKSNNTFFPENLTNPLPDSLKNNDHLITALPHLATLQITGSDANTFLQGQLSCDINELTESKSFFTAFCNAKGRTISTLLVIKRTNDFILLLPTELLEKVSKKLQMYIMRSDVQLKNMQDDLCLIGTNTTNTFPDFPQENFTVSHKNGAIFIKLPFGINRCLIISPASEAISLWKDLTSDSGLVPCHSSLWVEQDISAGIPWLSQKNSEEYIPQMLNIDKLGGISYTKGCYTGQEIIARTHYLGKAKRELFLACCKKPATINIDTQIITDTNEQIVGKVLSLQSNNYHTKMLVVMHSADTELKNLILNNSNQDKINIMDFQ